MDEVYRLIGIVVNNSQVIEYNLAYGLSLHKRVSCFDDRDEIPDREYEQIEKTANILRTKMNNMTLGNVIKLVSESKCFKPKVIKSLREVLDDRNYVVHQMIKNQFQPSRDEIEEMERYLKIVIEDTNNVNKSLCDRILALEKEYELIE